MAIEIIKKGRDLNPKYQGTCIHCECVFSFQSEDVVSQKSWRNEWYAKIRCPHCSRIVDICMDDVKIIEE